MANNIKGITIEIGGDTSPLDKALKDVNKTSRDLQSELREVNKQLKLDPTNTELLTQKQKLLAESVTNTKGKLDTLKEAERQVEQQFQQGKVSEEQYRALQREVIKTEQQLKTLGSQAEKSNVVLSKISSTAGKVGDAAGSIAGKMTPVTLAIAGAGAAAIEMSSDYSESLNKVEVAFKNNAKEVENWSKTTLDKFGIAGGTALDMAATFGDMGTSMGFTTGEASKMGMELVGRAGDLASFKNISIEVAKTALNGVYSGETESLKQLGVVMTQANLQEYAYSHGIQKKIEDMTQAEQVQLRYNYVMDATKNSQGDFARTSDGTANSTRVLGESVKELSATFGQQLLPIITPLIQRATELIKEFSQFGDGTKKTILIILSLIAAIAPIAGLISGIATIVGAVTAVIGTISGAIGLLTGTLTVATPAATALAGAITFITGPIGLTIIAITALVAGFIYLWTHCEGFRNFWIGLWNSIKEVTKAFVDFLVNFFTVIIPGAWNSVVSFFKGIPVWFSNLWTSVKTSTESIWNGVKNFFSVVWNGIKEFFFTVWNAIVAGVMVIVTPFINGITNIFNNMKDGLATILNGLKTYFTGIWEVIKNVFLGAILLILDLVTGNFTKLKSDAENIFNNLKNAFSQVWEGIKQIFTGTLEAIKGLCIGVWQNIVSNATTTWNSFSSFMSNLWDTIKSTAENAWNNLKTTVTNLCTSIKEGAINIWNSLLEWFAQLPSKLYNYGNQMFTSMKDGVTSTIGNVRSAIENGINNAVEFITSLPSKAHEWGVDFVDGLVNGIKSAVGKVEDAVSALSAKIRSYLHFSVPDVGPLTDYESWMPDFMSGLAQGIEKNKHLVTNAIKGLSGDMAIGVKYNSIPSTSTAVDNSKAITQNITINSPTALSPSETARQNKRALQELALGF